jgi:hypothetical protein
MMSDPIESPDTTPAYQATGDRTLRVRNIHPRHKQLLAVLSEDIEAGQREALALLLEFYAANKNSVLGSADDVSFRRG